LTVNAAHAQKTWTGGGLDDLLSTPDNWGGTAYVATEAITFDGSVRLTPVVDATTLTPGNITFAATAGAFAFGGATEWITDNVSGTRIMENLSTNTQSFNCPVAMRSETVRATAGDIVFNSPVRVFTTRSLWDGVKDVHLNAGLAGNADVRWSGPGTLFINGPSTGYVPTGTTSGTGASLEFGGGIVEINDDKSLGDPVNSDASKNYVFPIGNTGGTLALTNNITVGQFIYIYGRTTDADSAVLISNKSGRNTLTGKLYSDSASADVYRVISSNGTAVVGGLKDKLTISGDIEISNLGAAGTNGVLIFQGAGDGKVSGRITQSSGETVTWGEVRKRGAGTWTLSGANDYLGMTTVEAGKLLIDGTHVPADTSTAVYSVLASSTLGGNGSIKANTTVAGVLAPGDSVGTFTNTGNLTLTGTLEVEYSGTGAGSIDLLHVGGLLDLTGSTVNFSDLGVGPLTGADYIFATYGSLAGSPSLLNVPSGYSVDYAYGGNNIALVVPEPSIIALLVLAALGLLAYHRQKP
jgi:autotransporter-associated beta strand protein